MWVSWVVVWVGQTRCYCSKVLPLLCCLPISSSITGSAATVSAFRRLPADSPLPTRPVIALGNPGSSYCSGPWYSRTVTTFPLQEETAKTQCTRHPPCPRHTPILYSNQAGPEDGWLVARKAGESPEEHRDVLGLQTGEVGSQAGGDGPPFRLPGLLSAHSRKPLAPAALNHHVATYKNLRSLLS